MLLFDKLLIQTYRTHFSTLQLSKVLFLMFCPEPSVIRFSNLNLDEFDPFSSKDFNWPNPMIRWQNSKFIFFFHIRKIKCDHNSQVQGDSNLIIFCIFLWSHYFISNSKISLFYYSLYQYLCSVLRTIFI